MTTNKPNSTRLFSIIAAVTKNWGLGYEGKLPWLSFKDDMRWFKSKTQGEAVIMGRKTWESLGKKTLPKRQNIVLTSSWQEEITRYADSKQQGSDGSDLIFCGDLDSALDACGPMRQIFVIGGAGVYKEALQHPGCREVFLTHVDLNLPTDVKFPNLSAWHYRLHEVLASGEATNLTMWDNSAAPPTYWEICAYQRSDQSLIAVGARVEQTALPTCFPMLREEAGYLVALQNIIDFGEDRADRTGVGTRSLFGLNFRYDISQNFPLLTTKRTFWKGIAEELLWFLQGKTDSKLLEAKGVRIWQGNTSREYLDKIGLTHLREGDGGPIYGFNMRHWGAKYKDCETDYTGQGFDQIEYVVDLIKNNPTSRRILFTMYNPSLLKDMSLPPCHLLYQFYVSDDGKSLSCSMYQRSGDMGLGVPFNIASASLLTYMLAHLTGLKPKELVHTVGDCHIYQNHLEPLKKQIARTPRPFPKLTIVDRGQKSVEDFRFEDFIIQGYWPYPGIKMEMAV